MTQTAAQTPNHPAEAFKTRVRSAVIWRSGTQILGQLVTWAATFLVIRILSPSDYGLFAMTQVILTLLNMLNGYGFASALIQRQQTDTRAARQLFGMLLLLNGGLALCQFLAAPTLAAYYRQPIVADLLRVQALLYLFTPFIALPQALLSREMDFRDQAIVNFASALAGAGVSLGAALAGWGVWTLVMAPIALFGVRAIGLMIAARAWMLPSFDFRGAGDIARFGGVVAAGQIFWFLESQADVFIAGRALTPHLLGIYTTGLFLTQIFVSKFVPPLNEVAFSAYARMQHDRTTMANAFAKSVQLIFVAAMPFYLGLAVTAEPLVAVVLGPHWIEAAPAVRWLALVMPLMTLQVLWAPASDAAGRPGIAMKNGATGGILLAIAYLIGIQWGLYGLIAAWFVAYPPYLILSARRTLPLIGLSGGALIAALQAPVLASIAMALAVMLADSLLPTLPALVRLVSLVTLGAAIYGGSLFFFARGLLGELLALVRNRGT